MTTRPATARTLAAALGCLAIASACAPEPLPTWDAAARLDVMAGPDAQLRVWPADAELDTLALAAADRIRAASGLEVEVVDDERGAVPLFWSSRGKSVGNGWLGRTHTELMTSWIALDEGVPPEARADVITHEMIHALGVTWHVEQGAGIMSPNYSADTSRITAVDLEALCAVAACTTFAPEVAPPPAAQWTFCPSTPELEAATADAAGLLDLDYALDCSAREAVPVLRQVADGCDPQSADAVCVIGASTVHTENGGIMPEPMGSRTEAALERWLCAYDVSECRVTGRNG